MWTEEHLELDPILQKWPSTQHFNFWCFVFFAVFWWGFRAPPLRCYPKMSIPRSIHQNHNSRFFIFDSLPSLSSRFTSLMQHFVRKCCFLFLIRSLQNNSYSSNIELRHNVLRIEIFSSVQLSNFFSEWIWALARTESGPGQPGCEYKHWPDKATF